MAVDKERIAEDCFTPCFKPAPCCLLFGLVVAVGKCSAFAIEAVSYAKQLPSVCVEGRQLAQDFKDSQFTVGSDDNSENGNLQCQFLVNVYRCPEDKAEGCLQSNSDLKLMAQLTRSQKDIVQCSTLDARQSHAQLCSDKLWDCGSSKCTAYEKAKRLCVPELRKDSYLCYFQLGHPASGVTEAKVAFPVQSLLVALFNVVLFVFCCASPLVHYIENRGGSLITNFRTIAIWLCQICCPALMITILIYHQRCSAKPEDPVSAKLHNVTVAGAHGAERVVGNGSPVVPEEELVKQMPMWPVILIALSMALGPVFCWITISFAKLAKDQCSKDSKGEYSTGKPQDSMLVASNAETAVDFEDKNVRLPSPVRQSSRDLRVDTRPEPQLHPQPQPHNPGCDP